MIIGAAYQSQCVCRLANPQGADTSKSVLANSADASASQTDASHKKRWSQPKSRVPCAKWRFTQMALVAVTQVPADGHLFFEI